MSRRLVWTGCALGILAGLVWFSAHLAAVRIYQVDECQNMYMARVLAAGQSKEFFTNASLFLLGPLSWISRGASRSADAFAWARLLFLGVFWLNLFLLALIAGGRLYSRRTLFALLAAATLAPLWDYGFEVRHDNLVLTGVLLTWLAIRVRPMGLPSYILAGATAVAMLFIAFKSLVYVLPLSVAILAFPPPAHANPRLKLLLAWVGGAVLATVLIRISYGSGGGWDIYLSVFHGVAASLAAGASKSAGFGPWLTLSRLLGQAPLLLAVTAAACLAFPLHLFRQGRAALSWDTSLPELLLFLGAMAVLMTNPTPFPYNLLHVVPYAFLLGFGYCAILWKVVRDAPVLWPLTAGVLIFTHLVPFGVATRRHLDRPNWRQEVLMNLAENLTDPAKDPVYDAAGLVPTRPSVCYQWYLHSWNIASFLTGPGPRVRDILAARPAAVLIPSYRTDWLPQEDHDFIRQHYVSFADDFWVLGKVLAAGGSTIEISHTGRYRISSLQGSDLAGTYPEGLKGMMTPEDKGTLVGTLDGAPLSSGPVELTAGIHRIETTPDCQPAVVWVGPRLDRMHRVTPGDHRVLFYNWY